MDDHPSGSAAVTVERAGPVTTVTLSRPHARNAVDGPAAAALADAFRGFDADPDAAVAVLTGAGGTFCACLREDRASLLEEDGLDEAAAMANEFRHGRTSLLVDALPGAARFAAGAGRHGEGVQQ